MVNKASGRRGDAIDLTLDSPSPPLFSSHGSNNAIAGPSRVTSAKTSGSGRHQVSTTFHRSQPNSNNVRRDKGKSRMVDGDSTPEVRSETARSITSKSSGFGSAPNITDDEPFASVLDLFDARSLSSRESRDPGPTKRSRAAPRTPSAKPFANAVQLSSVRHSVSPRQPKKVKPEPKSPYANTTDGRRMAMIRSRPSRDGPLRTLSSQRTKTGSGTQKQPFEIMSSGESSAPEVRPLAPRKDSSNRAPADNPHRRLQTPSITASPAKRLKSGGAFGSHGKPKGASPFGPRVGRLLAKTNSQEWREHTPTPSAGIRTTVGDSPFNFQTAPLRPHLPRPADSAVSPSRPQSVEIASQISKHPPSVPPRHASQIAPNTLSSSRGRTGGSLDAPRAGAAPVELPSPSGFMHPAGGSSTAVKPLSSNLSHVHKRKRLDEDSDGPYQPKSSLRLNDSNDTSQRSTRPKPPPGAYTLPDPAKPEQWVNHSSQGSFKNPPRRFNESSLSTLRLVPANVPSAPSESSSMSGGPMTLTLPAATQRTPDPIESRDSSPLSSLASQATLTSIPDPLVIPSLETTDVGTGDAIACSGDEAKPNIGAALVEVTEDEAAEPVEEQEVDLLDMYADFEFTARSPTASQASAHFPPFTPTKTSLSIQNGATRSGTGPQGLLSPNQAKFLRGQTPHTPSNIYRRDLLATPSRTKRSASHPAVTPIKSAQKPGPVLSNPAAVDRSSKASQLVEQLLLNGEKQRQEQQAAFELEMQERQKRMDAVLLGANELEESNEEFFLQNPFVKIENEQRDESAAEGASRRSERIRSASHSVQPVPIPTSVRTRRSPSGIDLLIRERRSEIKRGTSGVGAGAALAVICGESSSPKKVPLMDMPYPTPESGVRSGSNDSEEPEEQLELDADRLRSALPDHMQVDTSLLQVADSRAQSMSRRASVMRGWDGFWGFRAAESVKQERIEPGPPAKAPDSPIGVLITDVLDTSESVSSLIVSGVFQAELGATVTILFDRLLHEALTIDDSLKRSSLVSAIASLHERCPSELLQAQSDKDLITHTVLETWQKMGAKTEYLPVSHRLSPSQSSPYPPDRQVACLTLCQLLAEIHLPAKDAECLVLPLVILAVDHETGPELYKGIQAALARLFSSCDDNQECIPFAARLVDGLASLPLELRADIIAVIGQSSAFTRQVSRWIAIDSLLPGCLVKLLADNAPLPTVPPLSLLEKATKRILMTVLAGEVDWENVAARFGYLAEAMTDMDALIAQHPLNMEQSREEAARLHPVQRLRVTVNGIHGKIRELSSVSVAPIKARISQMGLALRLRIEDSVYRQRRAVPKQLGSNLQASEGGGGQTKLIFSARPAAREEEIRGLD